MDDDTRLLCRIEVLKIIRYALQGHKSFEALKMAEDNYFKEKVNTILAKDNTAVDSSLRSNSTESRLAMTTRSADGSRPIRKRRASWVSQINYLYLFDFIRIADSLL